VISRLKNRFINGEKSMSTITGAAFLISCMGLASRFLGLIRDRILASKFGAGDELDIYYAAFRIPDFIFNLLILGTLSAAFIPVFTSLISRKKNKEAWKLVNNIFSLGLIVLSLAAVVLFFITPLLTKGIAFGFSPEKQASVTMLTRIMLLSPILLGLSGVLSGVLNSFKKFFFYSLAPIFYNIGIIIGVLVFTQFWGIAGLAWGVVLGALLHLLIQLPETIRSGFRFKFKIDLKSVYLKRVVLLMIPRALGLAMTQVNLLVVTILASTLVAGSLAIFNLSNNIQSVPLGIIGISFAIAAFPVLSAYWAKKERAKFIESFSRTFRNIMFFIIPFSVVFIILRAQIVRVVLGSGKFDWEDTTLTFQALGIFSLSLFAQSTIPLLARSFYAIQNTITPFLISIFVGVLNLILSIVFINIMSDNQVLGLVWSFSIATVVNMILLLVVLRKKIGDLREKEIIRSVRKVIWATLAMAVVMQLIKYGVSFVVDMQTFLGVFTQMVLSVLGGLAVFIFVGKILKIEELNYFIKAWKKRKFEKDIVIDEKSDDVGGS
jgi:putative peptidoglycan lipid II flippase